MILGQPFCQVVKAALVLRVIPGGTGGAGAGSGDGGFERISATSALLLGAKLEGQIALAVTHLRAVGRSGLQGPTRRCDCVGYDRWLPGGRMARGEMACQVGQ